MSLTVWHGKGRARRPGSPPRWRVKVTLPIAVAIATASLSAVKIVAQVAEPTAPAEAAASSGAKGVAGEWSATDTKLANHYIGLLQQTPEYGNVLNLLWELYEKREATPLLLQYIRGAAEGDDEGTAKLIHGHLLRKNGDDEAARARYAEVLELQPENVHALRGAAELFESDDKSAKALSYYNRLIPLLPLPDRTGADMRLRKAALLKNSGNIDDAVELWLEVLAAYPDDLGLRAEVVGLLLEANRVEGAVAVLREMMKAEDPELKVFALRELNRLYEFVADFDGAVATAREGLELAHYKHHVYAEFFARLVRLHERFGRLAELEESILIDARLDSPSEQAVYAAVEFYRLTANPLQREKWLTRLVELLPNNPAYRSELAHTQIENDHYQAAAETVDALLAAGSTGPKGGEPPLPLLLLRTRIELNLHGKEAAAERLQRYIDESQPAPESLRKVLAFSREQYLDGVVESLLRGPLANDDLVAKDDAPSAVRLAAFLRERGRVKQARQTLEDFVAAAGDDPRRRGKRLEQAAAAYREMDLLTDAMSAIDAAIELAPGRLDLVIQRAEFQVAQRDVKGAVATYESVWQRTETIDDKTEIDQRLFSLLRGLTNDAESSGVTPGVNQLPSPPPLGSSPAAMAQYRRKMAALSAAAARSGGGLGFANEAPPRELVNFYQGIKAKAKQEPTAANRYRVAWWAFRQQDHQEMYHQLAGLHDPDNPVIEAEQLMLELAEQTENTLLMARQLELLARIDPQHQTEYRQRWAEVRFKLGYEDEAVRLLEELARDPEATLATLKALAAVYQAQGRKQDQVGVWRRTYARGNVFEKRRVIKQLTNTLLELGQPSEALAAQMDLIRNETDLIQKRKHFDAQLSLANRQYLLGELLDSYRDLAQQAPFERFYPEALARIHRAMGNKDEAFQSMKKAYYMSGEDRELLAELGEMAGETSDLKAAIYYRRQLIAQDDDGTDAEGWKALIDMLERDLRVTEADRIRRRLEGKFAQDADFLKSMAEFYQRSGQRSSAARVLEELVRLRPWDATSHLELGLMRRENGNFRGALAAFEQAIEETAEAALSPAERDFEHLPLIRGGWFSGVGTRPSSGGLSNFVSGLQEYRYLTLELQDQLMTRFRRPHPEFHRVPRGDAFIRLRAIEEASRLVAAGANAVPLPAGASQTPAPTAVEIEDARDLWVRRWDQPGEISLTERLWAFYHVGDYVRAHRLLRDTMLPVHKSADQLSYLLLSLRMGRHQAVLDWLGDDTAGSDADFSDPATLPLVAAFLLMRENDEALPATSLQALLGALKITPQVMEHLIEQMAQENRIASAYRIAAAAAEAHPQATTSDACYRAAKLAQWLGLDEERRAWLERAVDVVALRSVPSDRHFAAGWVLPASFYQISSESLSLTPEPQQRESLRQRLMERVNADPGVAAPARIEAEALIAYASGDAVEGTRRLYELMSLRASGARPRQSTNSGRSMRHREFWMASERVVNQLALTLPPHASRRGFDAAFSPLEQGVASGDPDADAQYEQFEIARFAWSLEDLAPPERQVRMALFIDRLSDETSRLELAHTLESRGFFADVVPLYDRLIRENPEDFTLVRGFFQACREAQDYESALVLLNGFLARELPRSPGMTDAYLVGEHAHFLQLARDRESLTTFAQAHPLVGGDNGDDGNKPKGTDSSGDPVSPKVGALLFDPANGTAVDWSVEYHRALARVHEASGEKEAALRVYLHLRQLGVLELDSRLRAVDLLIEKGDSELARSWLAGVSFDSIQPAAEADVLRRLVELNTREGERDADKLGELARTALDYGDRSLAADVASTLFEAGLRAEAESMLLLRSRLAKDVRERTQLLLKLIELRLDRPMQANGVGSGKAEGSDGNSEVADRSAAPDSVSAGSAKFSAVATAVASLLEALTSDDPAAETWLELVRRHASADLEGWRRGLELIATQRSGAGAVAVDIASLALPIFDPAPLELARQLVADPDAPPVFNPQLWAPAGFDLAALALVRQPTEEGGDSTALAPASEAVLEQVGSYLTAQPVAPQRFTSTRALAQRIRALSRLGIDDRLAEMQRQLMLETAGGGMLRRLAVDEVSTFEKRWPLPRVLAESQQPELAGDLYRTYLDSIPRITRNHTDFIEDYARFLIERGETQQAESLLRRLFHKSLGGDPSLLVDLAVARGGEGAGTVDEFVQKFFLTPGLRLEVVELAARRELEASLQPAPAQAADGSEQKDQNR